MLERPRPRASWLAGIRCQRDGIAFHDGVVGRIAQPEGLPEPEPAAIEFQAATDINHREHDGECHKLALRCVGHPAILRLCCAGQSKRRRAQWPSTNSASTTCGPARWMSG